MGSAAAATSIKPKKKCCKDGPRCKRCPVVLERLIKQGLAHRHGTHVVLSVNATKADIKAARRRA